MMISLILNRCLDSRYWSYCRSYLYLLSAWFRKTNTNVKETNRQSYLVFRMPFCKKNTSQLKFKLPIKDTPVADVFRFVLEFQDSRTLKIIRWRKGHWTKFFSISPVIANQGVVPISTPTDKAAAMVEVPPPPTATPTLPAEATKTTSTSSDLNCLLSRKKVYSTTGQPISSSMKKSNWKNSSSYS